jgi:hypothetical protein
VQPQSGDLLTKLAEVEQNAWMLFTELPPSGAKTRALHVYLDAKAMKAALAPKLDPEKPTA